MPGRQIDTYSVGAEDPFVGCCTARFDGGYFRLAPR